MGFLRFLRVGATKRVSKRRDDYVGFLSVEGAEGKGDGDRVGFRRVEATRWDFLRVEATVWDFLE